MAPLLRARDITNEAQVFPWLVEYLAERGFRLFPLLGHGAGPNALAVMNGNEQTDALLVYSGTDNEGRAGTKLRALDGMNGKLHEIFTELTEMCDEMQPRIILCEVPYNRPPEEGGPLRGRGPFMWYELVADIDLQNAGFDWQALPCTQTRYYERPLTGGIISDELQGKSPRSAPIPKLRPSAVRYPRCHGNLLKEKPRGKPMKDDTADP